MEDKGKNEEVVATEKSGLVDANAAGAAAVAGAGFLNASANKIQKARAEGPLTFRMLGFIGGLAMIFSNAEAILERFFSFNIASCMIAIYGVFFGIVITMLEAPGPCSQQLQKHIRFYAKFLEFTWGRGALYFFVGSLQIANWNILDWVVGGFMMFVGVTAMGVGVATARQMRLLQFALKDEKQLKAKWHEHDADGNGYLDVRELTTFIKDAGVDMTKNEVAATFLALDRNFDEKLSYQEFYAWWASARDRGDRAYTV